MTCECGKGVLSTELNAVERVKLQATALLCTFSPPGAHEGSSSEGWLETEEGARKPHVDSGQLSLTFL